jgi:hypothetical protein
MMLPEPVGFGHPILARRSLRRRAAVWAELVTVAALVLSILVAMTVVSIDLARAALL